MIRFLRNVGLALFATLALFFAAPGVAQAADGDLAGCGDIDSSYSGWGTVCVFDGTNFGKWYWEQYDLDYLLNNCVRLPRINVISSIVVNPSEAGKVALNGFYFRMWPNDNCQGSPVPIWATNTEAVMPDLRYSRWGNVSNVANSIRVSR